MAPILLGALIAAALVLAGLAILQDDEPPVASETTSTIGDTTVATVPTTATTSTAPAEPTSAATTSATSSATTTTATPRILDPTLTATYGEHELPGGFVPDPFTSGLYAGGDVDTSYLDPGCAGWAAEAPDFKFQRTGATGGLLRFYFIPEDPTVDAVLLVNSPSSHWYCNDNSWSTFHPSVSFPMDENGRYDVWVATSLAGPPGTFVPGLLYVTETEANHP